MLVLLFVCSFTPWQRVSFHRDQFVAVINLLSYMLRDKSNFQLRIHWLGSKRLRAYLNESNEKLHSNLNACFPCTDNLQCRGDWFMPLLCFCNQQWVKMRIAVPPIQNTWILFFHPCEGKTIDFSFSFYLICPKLLTFVCQNVPLFLKFFTFLHAHT